MNDKLIPLIFATYLNNTSTPLHKWITWMQKQTLHFTSMLNFLQTFLKMEIALCFPWTHNKYVYKILSDNNNK